ncbi:tetratricopeptide repeat protein [Jannaschia sp. CCS1]|uniref:tetratricopeptide repeat protein n=1 Tax=Jannaschia sp. (strain CCS1) TaxID=290400 RepID=UPI00006BFFF4|nr:tetratricopeptide repeat protein [Jannaschia sp. CCS1]ABD54495.1 transcriptional regulator, SARP family [Jannaschia sp. CCS1]
MAEASYKLFLIGPFRLTAPSGEIVDIKGKKSRAILAALGTGRDMARARSWIAAHLWSGRGAAQAAASYRQCILELRRALGADADLLDSGTDMVALDPARVWVDAVDEEHLTQLSDGMGETPQFLADLSIRDPEFERWVADRRTYYGRRLSPAPPPPPQTKRLHRPIVIRTRPEGAAAAQTYNAVLQDLICKSIDDTGKVRLLDEGAMPGLTRDDADRAFRVEVSSVEMPGTKGVSVNLTRSLDGTVFTTLTRLSESVDMIDLVNEAVVQSLDEIAGYEAQLPSAKIATAMCFRAMQSITDYAPTTIEAADRLISNAYEIDPQPVFLAWRAYLRTFLLGESGGGNSQAISEEMERFINLAEEREPGNSIILSLAAFIRSMWLLSSEDALDLAQRSHALNPSNPYGISYLGMVHTHLGNFEEGYRLTRRANALTVPRGAKSSIRYVAMRSAACAGRYTEAIKIGEALGRDAPHFVAPKRLMGLLYMKCGRVADAEAMVETLRQHEPDYSMEKMRDAFRASPLLHRSKLGKAG